MADVPGDHIETEMKRGCSNQQVRKRENDASFRLAARDGASEFRDLAGKRIYGYCRAKIVQERLARRPLCVCLRALNSMCELNDSYSRYSILRFAPRFLNLFQDRSDGKPPPLRCD